ncbi:hypothetical protein DYB32_003466 [Aphanomyces invadans]|uniref:Uncharacterized protein n=1 Tax=Aphanomyces invadans TaxID=157072 RepID=A0A3R6YBA1_9STRA|nr:hypothetical protein DYB32_003466 [Aphanomyces invadans]
MQPESYRHALVPKDEMIQVVVKQIKHQTYSYITPLTFVIKIHHLSHEFKIDYGDYRKFIRTMVATPMFESPIRALYVSKLLEDSFAGAMRRAVASIEYLSKELAIALNDLVQIPHLAAHPTFLKLARIDSFRAIFEVLVHGASNHGAWQLPPAHRKDAPTPMPVDDDEVDNSSNSTEPTSLDGSQDCLCALFAHGTAIFASHIAGDATPSPSLDGPNTGAALVDCQLSVEKVLCMYLMQSRSLLVFYADTQYQKCIVAGFGAKALFQISRISKTEWALVDVRYPTVALLSLQLQKQSGRKPSVAMYRVLPRGQPSECIGMFYKHRRRYEFQLLSELLTQGKITTSISIASGLVNHKYRHNVLCSVAGGRSDEFVSAGAATALSLLMTSAMSVPQMNLSKQRLHVSDGADVLLHIGLAVSFDILMSARPLFQRSDFIY